PEALKSICLGRTAAEKVGALRGPVACCQRSRGEDDQCTEHRREVPYSFRFAGSNFGSDGLLHVGGRLERGSKARPVRMGQMLCRACGPAPSLVTVGAWLPADPETFA